MGTGTVIQSDIISLTIFAGLLSLLPVTILLWMYYVRERKPTVTGKVIAQFFGLGMVSVGIAGVIEREVFSLIGTARDWVGMISGEAYEFRLVFSPIASVLNGLARAMFAEHIPPDNLASIFFLIVIAFFAIALVEEGARMLCMRLVLREHDNIPAWHVRIIIAAVLVAVATSIYSVILIIRGEEISSALLSFVVTGGGHIAPGGAALLIIAFFMIARVFARSRVIPSRPIDGVQLGIATGLGFAFVENTIYFLYTFQQAELSTVLVVFFLRFLLSTTAHMTFGGIMGYYLMRGMLHPERRREMFRRALWIPVLLHGTFDFLLVAGFPIYVVLLLIGALFTLWCFWHDRRMFEQYRMHGKTLRNPLPYRRIHISSPLARPVEVLANETSCPVCNMPIQENDERCVSCGVLFARKEQPRRFPFLPPKTAL